MPRKLTIEELDSLAGRSRVDGPATRKFLGDVDLEDPPAESVLHLIEDANLQDWNGFTVGAILDGLDLMYETEAPGAYENRPKGGRSRPVSGR